MSRKEENTNFICMHCGNQVKSLKNGSYRNHCPYCLYSLHLDIKIGDRKNECRGLMKPTGVKKHKKKGMQIIHECTVCGEVKVNKIAEDIEQSDNMDKIIKLMSNNYI